MSQEVHGLRDDGVVTLEPAIDTWRPTMVGEYTLQWNEDGSVEVFTDWGEKGVYRFEAGSDGATLFRGVVGPIFAHRPPGVREGDRVVTNVQYVARQSVYPKEAK